MNWAQDSSGKTIYDFFTGTREVDLIRYAPGNLIRQWLGEAGFAKCETVEVERMSIHIPAREALESGRLAKESTSQLALLTDEEYRKGIERILADMIATEARGEEFELTAELHLFASLGFVATSAGQLRME